MNLSDYSSRSAAELAFEGSPDAIFIESTDGFILEANPAACRLHGLDRDRLVGRHVLELVPPDRRPDVARDFPKLTAGQWTSAEGESWTADGRRVPVQIRTASIEYDGKPALLLIVRDLSEHRRLSEDLRKADVRNVVLTDRQSMLLDELNHRVRNNLTGLMSLIDLYQRSCATADEMAAAMRQKLRAIQSAHALIARADWHGVEIGELLDRIVDQAAAQDPHRLVTLDGPPVHLSPHHASVVAMIAQELCANAVKHGALSRIDGRVDVRWQIGGDGLPPSMLALQWIESCEDAPTRPARLGVGLRLIEGFAAFDLGGRCALVFEPVGFRCRIDWPISPATASPASSAAGTAP